jgi:hypothetical protein
MSKGIHVLENEATALSGEIASVESQFSSAIQRVRDSSAKLLSLQTQYAGNVTALNGIIANDPDPNVVAQAEATLTKTLALATEFLRLKTSVDAHIAAIDAVEA